MKALLSKAFILFLIKLAVLFAIYYLWFKPNCWTLPVIGTYYSHFIHYTLKFVMEPSAFILELLNYEVEIEELRHLVVQEPRFKVTVMNDCLGTDMMFAFAALVIAFPGKMIDRLWFLPLGWLGVQIINIVRIVGLTLVWLRWPPDGSFDTHDMFNIATTLFVLGMFLFWVKRYKKVTVQ